MTNKQATYDPEKYQANKERYKETQYKSNEKHKEKRIAYRKAYYQANKEKMDAYQKAYILKKKEEELEEQPVNIILKNGTDVYNPKSKKFEKK